MWVFRGRGEQLIHINSFQQSPFKSILEINFIGTKSIFRVENTFLFVIPKGVKLSYSW